MKDNYKKLKMAVWVALIILFTPSEKRLWSGKVTAWSLLSSFFPLSQLFQPSSLKVKEAATQNKNTLQTCLWSKIQY